MLCFRTALSTLARAAAPLRTRAATRTLAATPVFLGNYVSTPKVAPTVNGKHAWEKKLTFYITPSDIIQILSWVPTQEIKLSRTAARLAETTGSDTAPITRTLSFRASEGGVMATVGTIRPGVAAESETQSIELSAIDFQLLKTQLSTAIPWLTGWMQQLNPLTYDEATHAASSWGERAQTYRGSGPV